MIRGVWGKKLGMSQRFINDKVVPVTAIEVADWFITDLRTKERNGYNAVQIAQVKKKYRNMDFSDEWLKNSKKYFTAIKEIHASDDVSSLQKGTPLADKIVQLTVGEYVDVTGITKGAGFQGVVKRHGFTGGRASHGDKTGRHPGSGGCIRRGGKVFKGKRFPGHMGVEKQTMQNLEVVAWQDGVLLVKGSIPGKARSLVFVGKN